MALLPMKMTTMKSMDKVWRIMELMKQEGEEEEVVVVITMMRMIMKMTVIPDPLFDTTANGSSILVAS